MVRNKIRFCAGYDGLLRLVSRQEDKSMHLGENRDAVLQLPMVTGD